MRRLFSEQIGLTPQHLSRVRLLVAIIVAVAARIKPSAEILPRLPWIAAIYDSGSRSLNEFRELSGYSDRPNAQPCAVDRFPIAV